MNFDSVERIAEAVLFEGYMLYPYRASAVKNQQRWNFGVLYPRAYSEQQSGSDAWTMQTECLLEADPSTRLNIEIRFLQIVNRSIGKLLHPASKLPASGEPEFELVDKLSVGGRTYTWWQEAMERKVNLPPFNPAAFSLNRHSFFEFGSQREFEPIANPDGIIEGVIVREWESISGSIEVVLKKCRGGVFKATVRLRNLTRLESPQVESRADALPRSFVSAHTIFGATGGAFVSLLDPPDDMKDFVTECTNIGTWPVLVGEAGDRSAMLSSPIILYDYPQIAPESPGSLFDGTEIDEILSLRILTMTDGEKKEMRQSDGRAREILERTEKMPPEQFMKLHGVLRGLRSVPEEAQ
jgi:hydrogenase maturation protease